MTGFTFNQFNRDNSLNYISFTVNDTNKNYLCSDLPYINTSTHDKIIIKSNIDTTITRLTFSYTTPIGTITTSNSQTYIVNTQSSPITLSNLITSNGDTILTLNHDTSVIEICEGYFNMGTTGFSFIVLLIIVSSAGIILFFIFGGDDLDMISLAIVIIVVSIILVLGMIVINSFGNGC